MKKLINLKRLAMCMVIALCVVGMSVSAFAADESPIAAAMETGLQKMLTDLMALVAVVLPIGLTVFAAFFGVKKAVSMLRATSGG